MANGHKNGPRAKPAVGAYKPFNRKRPSINGTWGETYVMTVRKQSAKPLFAKPDAKVPGRDTVTGRFTPAPRRVPFGFVPGQTAYPITIAR